MTGRTEVKIFSLLLGFVLIFSMITSAEGSLRYTKASSASFAKALESNLKNSTYICIYRTLEGDYLFEQCGNPGTNYYDIIHPDDALDEIDVYLDEYGSVVVRKVTSDDDISYYIYPGYYYGGGSGWDTSGYGGYGLPGWTGGMNNYSVNPFYPSPRSGNYLSGLISTWGMGGPYATSLHQAGGLMGPFSFNTLIPSLNQSIMNSLMTMPASISTYGGYPFMQSSPSLTSLLSPFLQLTSFSNGSYSNLPNVLSDVVMAGESGTIRQNHSLFTPIYSQTANTFTGNWLLPF